MFELISHSFRRHVALTLVVGTASINVAHSQIAGQYNSRPLRINARAAAFADAYVAEAYDVSSLYWNPAALMFVRTASAVANVYYAQTHEAVSENITIPLPSSRRQSLAIGATFSQGGQVDSVSSSDRFMRYGLDVGYARAINPSFSIGIRVGVHFGWSKTIFSSVISSSVGIFYSPSPEISYGVAFHGVGTGIRNTNDGSSSVFGLTADLENLSRSLQIGSRLRFPSATNRPALVLAVASEKIFEEDGLAYKGGIEIHPVGFLAFRVGYVLEPSKEAANYGVGVRTGWLLIDYAISPSSRFGRFHQVSLSLPLKSESYGTRR